MFYEVYFSMHSNSLKRPSLSGMSTFLFYPKIMKVVMVLLKIGDNINQDKELDELLCKRVGRGKRQFENQCYW